MFVAVIGAAVLAGWRAGLVAVLLGQVLAWYFVAAPRWSFAAKDSAEVAALMLATLSQAIALVIVALYQREIDRTSAEREGQIALLDRALKEIDHRTSNNYQTVIAMVLAQARSCEGEARNALEQVADRIRAISNASRKLAVASQSLEAVRADEHLEELCRELERGLARPEVRLDCRFDEILLPADETVSISILVNELVTNALKHAFPDGGNGRIGVSLNKGQGSIVLSVEDDGVGLALSSRSRGTGLGTRLVETFVRQLGAKHEVRSQDRGTRHLIRIPA